MISSRLFSVVCCLFLLGMVLAPRARADEWDQMTRLTFTHPVEVPGMTLPAGKYVFSLMNDDSDRNIVQIWNADRTKLYATILAIPDYRMRPTGRTVVEFEERPASQPEALKEWFYPGDLYGHEFVYPRSRATELAKKTGQPVLSMPNEAAAGITQPVKSAKEPAVTAMKQAPIKAVHPNGTETEVARTAAPPATEQAAVTRPKHLPQTASWLPFWEVLGLVSLAAGLALRHFTRRLT